MQPELVEYTRADPVAGMVECGPESGVTRNDNGIAVCLDSGCGFMESADTDCVPNHGFDLLTASP
jgi:hypothetical protein